jgi:hypothetical protein
MFLDSTDEGLRQFEEFVVESAPCLETLYHVNSYEGVKVSILSVPKLESLGFSTHCDSWWTKSLLGAQVIVVLLFISYHFFAIFLFRILLCAYSDDNNIYTCWYVSCFIKGIQKYGLATVLPSTLKTLFISLYAVYNLDIVIELMRFFSCLENLHVFFRVMILN